MGTVQRNSRAGKPKLEAGCRVLSRTAGGAAPGMLSCLSQSLCGNLPRGSTGLHAAQHIWGALQHPSFFNSLFVSQQQAPGRICGPLAYHQSLRYFLGLTRCSVILLEKNEWLNKANEVSLVHFRGEQEPSSRPWPPLGSFWVTEPRVLAPGQAQGELTT